MAAKKSESAKQTIVGTVRHGGKAYTAGQEEELQAALDDAGVKEIRGFGVDSTDRSTKAVRNDSKRAEIAARAAQAQAEAHGKSGKPSDEEVPDLSATTLADLPAALEGITDKKVLQAAKRKDKRAGAKSLYADRLEAINAAASGEEDEADEAEEE